MAFERVDIRRCTICGVNRDEVENAHDFINSGANNDYAHTSNPYYKVAWKIITNYQQGKYDNYVHSGPSYTDIDIITEANANGYHKRCFDSLPVAKSM